MAVFGAPVALEDHAFRACRAALDIHSAITDLAEEIRHRDGVQLEARIGLNSGQVIAGEIGTTAVGYTTIGEQVGLAQRMESVAPPGGVMVSPSTARLVEGAATLGELELVQIKGAGEPVPARRRLGMGDGHRAGGRVESCRQTGRHRWAAPPSPFPAKRFSSAMARADAGMHQARSGDRNTAILVEPTQPSRPTRR